MHMHKSRSRALGELDLEKAGQSMHAMEPMVLEYERDPHSRHEDEPFLG
jgi:hypothetical protein